MVGLRAVYDPAFDSGAWPGPGTSAGEVWVGTEGLVDLLERRLALRNVQVGPARRAAALVPRLATPGFWSRSAEVDPFGTARRLLRWRDALALEGWRFQPASPRLAALADVTADSPGLPERLQAVRDRLARLGSPLRSVTVLSAPGAWMVRDLLQVLGATPAPPPVPSQPRRIRLVRPAGPLEAAEEAAAWLAGEDRHVGAVVVSPAPCLDLALRRHGLPTLGVPSPPGQDSLLQVLPLVLACGWNPPDPERVLELLTLPLGPIPKGLAWRLASALQEWPSVGSPLWRTALEEGLPGLEPHVQERVAGLLRGEVERVGGYPSALAASRATFVARWLRARAAEPGPWSAALGQCLEFGELLDACGLTVLSEAQLQRLVALATEAVAPASLLSAAAGLRRVGEPGGVAGPARRVLWWDFSRGSISVPLRIPLTHQESAALAALGVRLREPASEARAQAQAWRRPLDWAGEDLVLVCPRSGEDGLPAYLHPLWHEFGARATRLEVVNVPRTLRPLPRSQACFRLPAEALPERPRESASSLARLVSCPLVWVLRDAAGLRAGRTQRLPGEALLLGGLVHELLARALPTSDPRGTVEQLFDTLGPELAAPLFLPGADAVRARTRHVTLAAAEILARHLDESGMQVLHVELPCSREGAGCTVEGRLDLVVGPPETILDLKWSGARRHLEPLQQGTAHQLAVYSYLRGLQPVGYFTLLDGTLMVTEAESLVGARVVEGPPVETTWQGLEAAVRARRDELDRGFADAPGNGEGPVQRDLLHQGLLVLVPPCRYCGCGVLCGKAVDDDAQP